MSTALSYFKYFPQVSEIGNTFSKNMSTFRVPFTFFKLLSTSVASIYNASSEV